MKTKDKIFLTAQKLFFKNGIDRTSVKDIAEKANINIAALNYHYRSKENLIDIVFEKVISAFSPALPQILDTDLLIEEKLQKYISALNGLLLKYNPHLPFFIMSIMQRNPEKIIKLKIFKKLYNPEIFYKQLIEEGEKGTINKLDPVHFFLTILSLIGFPYAMQHVMMGANNWTKNDFKKFILDREEMILGIAMDILKGNNKSYIIYPGI